MEKDIEVKMLDTCADKLREAKQLILETLYEAREEPVFSGDEITKLRCMARALVVIARRIDTQEDR